MAFPRSDINPRDKNEAWYVAMVKGIWEDWQTINTQSFFGGAGRYNRLEHYAQGKQSTEKYKPQLGIDEKDKFQWTAIDFSPIPVLPKSIRIINSIFRKIRMLPEIKTIDPFSDRDKEEAYADEMSRIKMRPILEEAGLDPGLMDTDDPEQPMSEEELDIQHEFKWKHKLSIGIEKGLRKFELDMGWDEEREKVRQNLIKFGAGGYWPFTDAKTGKVEARSIDVSSFICSATKDPYMRDIWYGGEITYPLISEIRAALGPDVDENKLERLAENHRGKYGNPLNYGLSGVNNVTSYDSARVPVLDIRFKNENTYLFERKEFDNGNFVLGKTAEKKRNYGSKRQYYEDKRKDIFCAKWVIDSDIIYDFGLENDMVKKASRFWDAQLPIIMCAPNLYNMETSSPVEELIPLVDAVHLAWFKLQNTIAQARPKGIEIEIGSLENSGLEFNGEAVTPIQLIDLFNKKGILVYRRIDPSGAVSNYTPIRELNNGLGTEAQEYFAHILNLLGLIKNFVGLNDLTDASTPDERTLNGVASLAAEGTNNALHHIFDAEKNLFERLFDNVACRILDSVIFKKSDYYADAMGSAVYRDISTMQKKSYRELGVIVQFAPSEQEKAKLEGDITAALAAGQITLADKYEILQLDNLKMSQQLLAYRITRNMEEAQERELEKIQVTTDQQKEAAIVAEDEKRKTAEFTSQLKMKELQFEYQLKMQLEAVKLGIQGANKSEEIEGKKEIQGVANEGLINVARERKTPQESS
jgi:hypothetical protein